jgi:hypothetical protein
MLMNFPADAMRCAIWCTPAQESSQLIDERLALVDEPPPSRVLFLQPASAALLFRFKTP